MKIYHPDDRHKQERWKRRSDKGAGIALLLFLLGLLLLSLQGVVGPEVAVRCGVAAGIIMAIAFVLWAAIWGATVLKARRWRFHEVHDELALRWARLAEWYDRKPMTVVQFNRLPALLIAWDQLLASVRSDKESNREYSQNDAYVTAWIIALLQEADAQEQDMPTAQPPI